MAMAIFRHRLDPVYFHNRYRILRADGRLEDEGDFNDFYIQPTDDMDFGEQKELQELQDEELARLLQDQEKKVGKSPQRVADIRN